MKEKTDRQLLIKTQPSLYEAFEKKCNEEHRSVSEVLRELMSNYSREKGVTMSHVNYNPSKHADLSVELYKFAEDTKRQIVHIICDDNTESSDSVDFAAVVDFVPRIGERIVFEDISYQVVSIIHSAKVYPRNANWPEHTLLVANVYAKKVVKTK